MRNRLTVAFRIILAIPHLILAGGVNAVGGGVSFSRANDGWDYAVGLAGVGVLGVASWFCAIISWFAILFTGVQPRGLWDFEVFVLRWQVRTTAYLMLFRDEYPPFGEADYPATLHIEYPEGPRDRLSVGLRLIYAIPHIIIVGVLGIAWFVTTVIAWFAILFTGTYPAGLAEFGRGVFRWTTRVSAYTSLLRDEYPPFSLNA